MELSEYHKRAMEFSILQSKSDEIQYGLWNLAGEVGELSSKHAKALRDETPMEVDGLVKEAGDILWSLTCYLNGLGVDLEEVAEMNIRKLQDRTNRGVVTGSGDER